MAADLTAVPSEARPADGRPGRRRRAIVAAAALALLGGMAATGLVGSGSGGRAGPVAVEGPAPTFDLVRVGDGGDRVHLAQFTGRPLVVNFWASWCVPCRKEMPALGAAAERLAGQVWFVGINHRDGRTSATAFERDVGVGYPSGFDPDGGVARRFGVVGLPTTVFVDARGRIVARQLGEITDDELLELVAEAFGITTGDPSASTGSRRDRWSSPPTPQAIGSWQRTAGRGLTRLGGRPSLGRGLRRRGRPARRATLRSCDAPKHQLEAGGRRTAVDGEPTRATHPQPIRSCRRADSS